jgi:hypothetical protein
VNSALDRYGESQQDKSKRDLLADEIELCMKERVLDNSARGIVCQWKFCWTKENTMESLTGSTAQKILDNMKNLTGVCFRPEMDEDSPDHVLTRQKNKQLLKEWNIMCDNLRILWILIEKKTEYRDQDVDDLHVMSNLFMTQWVQLLGKEHVTNYIHIVGSGHLTFFAAKFCNLYRFSQQGWESLNQLLKHYYFNNTNHGGAAGNGGKMQLGFT